MSAAAQLAWTRRILRTFVDLGVRHAVFSPGSRSTPLVLAALDTPGLDVLFEHDERVAGFHALGLSRASGNPVLLACTSGTAPAHYYPALIEATRAGHPLIVLSADRPPELHGREASQTIDQHELFGRHVKRFVDLGCAELEPHSLQATLAAIAAGVGDALSIRPGAVHFNVAFRKPFEPGSETEPDLPGLAAPAIQRALRPAAESLDPIVRCLRDASRPLALLGPARLDEAESRRRVLRALDALGLPYAAEPASQARFTAESAHALGPAELLLETDASPDLVLQIGQPPTSGALERALGGEHAPRLAVLAEEGRPDPTRRADQLVVAPLAEALERLASDPRLAPDDGWRECAASHAKHHADISSRLVEAEDTQLDDLSAMRCALDALPEAGYLALGNSLPVRVADLVAPASGLELAGVLHQRGAAGIDGLAAGAVGSARALRAPLLLAYGEVSFAHDMGGLLAARRVDTPLVLLVFDNGGGRIFEELPIRDGMKDTAAFERAFLTPTGLDILAAARACGLEANEAHEVGELRSLLASALAHAGASVVVARISDSATHRALAAFKAELAAR